ncbi:MAG: hypothetical protein WD824_24675 [Cyclobacteriaceae bacterium]
MNYSIARTTDTYKGFSTEKQFGLSFAIDPVSIGLMAGASMVSSKSLFGHLQNANQKIGQLTGGSSLGISISSKGVKTQLSLYGNVAGGKNNLAGRISSYTNETDRGTIPIGMIGSISLKDFYTRYWSDETQAMNTYGSLYPGIGNAKIESDHYSAPNSGSDFISYAFDSYDLFDDIQVFGGPSSNDPINNINDPAKQLGGSLPSFDRYDVLGQGIGGTIQPHIFENGDMFGQNIYLRGNNGEPASGFPQLGYKSLKKFSDKKVSFRFLNDFSNALTLTTPDFESNGTDLSVDPHVVDASSEGYNDDDLNQKLAGSKHIEWFTNEEIANEQAMNAGFIDCYVERDERRLELDVYENYLQPEACLPYSGTVTYGKGHGSFKTDTYEGSDPYADILHPQFRSLKPTKADLKKKIGGFMITNETGVSYHYALPVYNYNEYTRSKLKKPRQGVSTFREYKNDEPYAYTWLLTAITGPDYVDRNDNEILDDEDWGYWVKFDYGRWADSYQWRTPHTGYTNDIESEYETFSYGIKELYYLDAIETRSHKAIFIKSKRKDGRGVTSRLEGGSNPRKFSMEYRDLGSLTYNVSPVSTMKLDAIYLFNKADLASMPVSKTRGEKYNEATSSNPHPHGYDGLPYEYSRPYTDPGNTVKISENQDFVYVKYHNGYLVYDEDDIHDIPAFREKALRIIELETDYSLTAGVPNSIGFFADQIGETCFNLGEFSCDAEVNERIGEDYEWPTTFGDGCAPTLQGDRPVCCFNNTSFYSKEGVFASYHNGPEGCSAADNPFAGKAINYVRTGKLTLKQIKFLGKGGSDQLPPTVFNYSENPGYFVNKYDQWGYYKNDYPELGEYVPDEGGGPFGHYEPVDSNTTREITDGSAPEIDAWSLSSVTTPLGATIEIEYEPNSFQKSVYNDFSVFSIEKLEPGANANEVKITFREKGVNLNKWLSSSDPLTNPIEIKAFILEANSSEYEFEDTSYLGNPSDEIIDIGTDEITVISPGLRDAITPKVISGSTMTDQYFVSGFIKVTDPLDDKDIPNHKFSGGIRVKSLSVVDEHIGKTSAVYDYNDPITEVTSGVTSYKPYNIPSIQYPVDVDFFDRILQDNDKKVQRANLEVYQVHFQKEINAPFSNVLSFGNEAPAPGGIYESVTVRNYVNELSRDNYTVNRFRVFEESMITRERSTALDGNVEKRTVTIKNNAVSVGNLVSSKTYNQQNQPVRSVAYNYLMDENNEGFEQNTIDSKQGIVEQSFHKSMVLRDYTVELPLDNWWCRTFGGCEDPEVDVIYDREKAIITKRQVATDVVTSVKEIDHLTGLIAETQNHEFDFFSGQPTNIRTSDSYGNNYISKLIPAYRQYAEMGLKIYDVTNKHMLTQPAAQYAFSADGSNEPTGLLSASIQTWSKQIPILNVSDFSGKIWRKKAQYQWNSQLDLNDDGTFSVLEFNGHTFNWTSEAQSDWWEKTQETTLYDFFSHELEAKDINGAFMATHMNNTGQRVIASADNASYHEMSYSGAESYIKSSEKEGGVGRGHGKPSSAQVHTGSFGLLVETGEKGFNFSLVKGKADLTRKYRASVWVYAPGEAESQSGLNMIQLYYTINGIETASTHPVVQKNKSKSWYLLNLDITPDGDGDVFVGVRNNAQRGVYFDDFRVHPLDAALTSFVYDQFTGELNYILDGNNFYTRFQYDAAGRLVRTSKELLNFDYGPGKETGRVDAILEDIKYNYGKSDNND